MNQTNTPAPGAPVKKKSSNSMVIIIVVAVVALAVLGVGGYFGWKYVAKKFIKSSADTSPTPKSTSASSLTLSELETMLKYPNGTLTSTDHSKASGFASVLQMETSDTVVTANDYYLNLNSSSKWTVVAKSLETDNSRADITYEGTKEKFTVTFVIDHVYDNTAILVRIDTETLALGTPLGSGSATPTTTSNTTASSTKTAITGDYVITDSATRVIAETELTKLSAWQLKVGRNEIYARHGRPFVHKDLQCYFATKSWYVKDESFTEAVLSSTETKNIATIQAYEIKINSPLQSTDSGC